MARHEADRWSDIDLALQLAPAADLGAVVGRWTDLLQERGPVAGHLDIGAGEALYRVFLLSDSLQVDLSFWPAGSFGSTGEPFEVLFGQASGSSSVEPVDVGVLVGWGWLYALHARSALARGKVWQALQMVDGLRDQLIALACLRRELQPFEGRGVDQLPAEELAALMEAVAPGPDVLPLRAALAAGLELLHQEVGRVDVDWAKRLGPALAELGRP